MTADEIRATAAQPPRVAIVGGGLAGLAAALRLREHGCPVSLFEARRQLGGRAASFRDPQRDELVDYCQHVSMGCCTNLADFATRTRINPHFERLTQLDIFASSGKRYALAASPLLPAPLHLLPALLRLGYLSWRDRFQTIRLLTQLAKVPPMEVTNPSSMLDWLQARNVSPQALSGFWNVILVSALGDTVDHVSVPAARKVLVDGFMSNRRAYEVLVPTRSLSELMNGNVGSHLTGQGVQISRSMPVQQIKGADDGRLALQTTSQSFTADAAILATSWRHLRQLLAPDLAMQVPAVCQLDEVHSAPITGVHLWLDRSITPRRHAILVGRLSQWLFSRPLVDGSKPIEPNGYYCQVVISGSHDLADRPQGEIVAEVLADLAAVFHRARDAKLLQARMVTDPHAVFSCRPGLARPSQRTPVRGLFIAGDWTDTGWPATMEGAVRSGYLAAEALLSDFGRPASLLAPDLPRNWLSRRVASGD